MADRSSTRSRLTYPKVAKLRIACAIVIAAWLAGLAAVALLAVGLSGGLPGIEARTALLAALGAIAALVVLAGLGFALANELPCNVCRMPLLLAKRCRKHVKARRLLGFSYTLGVAVPALFTNRYHCMHCGEKIPLTRQRDQRPVDSGIRDRRVPGADRSGGASSVPQTACSTTTGDLPAPR